MAIAYDTGGTTNAYGPATITHNIAATSADSIAMIVVFKDSGDTVTGVTVGGNAATYVGKQNLTGDQWGYIYYYLNPPTSSTAYTATASASGSYWDISVDIYSGAKQSGQMDSSATGTATGNLTFSTTVVASNCWLFSYARNAVIGVPAAGTGTTSRTATTLYRTGDSNGVVGTGAQTMQYTAATGTTAGIIVSIAPAGATSTFTPRTSFFM